MSHIAAPHQLDDAAAEMNQAELSTSQQRFIFHLQPCEIISALSVFGIINSESTELCANSFGP